jgi:hypothetical protein
MPLTDEQAAENLQNLRFHVNIPPRAISAIFRPNRVQAEDFAMSAFVL